MKKLIIILTLTGLGLELAAFANNAVETQETSVSRTEQALQQLGE